MPELQWTAVAGSPGQRLIDAYHGVPLGFGGTFRSMTGAWTGGCVDQSRGELVFAANGGHADYAGNEVYACRIRSETPAWYRLNDPSPEAMIAPIMEAKGTSTSNTPEGQGFTPSGFAGMFLDGRMRAVHGWHSAIFANGKVWYPYQASVSGIGHSTAHAWSFNRDFSGLARQAGETPLSWQRNPGPWTWLGTSSDGQRNPDSVGERFGTGPPSAIDPVTGLIWTAHADQAQRVWSSLDTATGRIRRSNVVNVFAPNTSQDGKWAAVVVDPSGQDRWRLWIAPTSKGVIVLNLKAPDPYDKSAWTLQPVSDAVAIGGGGLGAVYHAPSMSVLLGNPRTLGGNIIRLRVPTDSSGGYEAGVAWQVSTISGRVDSANPGDGATIGNGAWSKFNIIQDMGNGHAALVVCMEVDKPTYVLKLPVHGV